MSVIDVFVRDSRTRCSLRDAVLQFDGAPHQCQAVKLLGNGHLIFRRETFYPFENVLDVCLAHVRIVAGLFANDSIWPNTDVSPAKQRPAA